MGDREPRLARLAGERLLGTGTMRRCPACGTFFSWVQESDPHHFYPAGTDTLSRIELPEVLERLTREPAGRIDVGEPGRRERWRRETGYAAWIADLARRARGGRATAQEVGLLVSHHAGEGAWDEVAALLRSTPRIRLAAVTALSVGGYEPPPAIHQALAALVREAACAVPAREVLQRFRPFRAVTPALPGLVALLGHRERRVRETASELVRCALSPWKQEPGETHPEALYRRGRVPRLGARLVAELTPLLPALARELDHVETLPRIAAGMVCDALAYESEEVARLVRDALKMPSRRGVRRKRRAP